MKARRIKQVILALLALILMYIWWGNLRLFYDRQSDASQPQREERTVSRHTPQKAPLQYRPPQVNPFRRYDNHSKPGPNASAKSIPAPPIDYLHTAHRLSGILPRGKTSQAIVLTPQNKSAILEIGDSLGTWQLTTIRETFATFRQGKRYDTLWLAPRTK